MMSDETAKALIEALNRFSGVLERLQGGSAALGGGIHIYHHGLQPIPTYQPVYQPAYPSINPWPVTCGNTGAMS